MMARRGMLGVLAGGAAALLGGCGLSGNASYRFKMTVEVETPEGVKTGWSVYEVQGIGTQDLITGGNGSYTKLRGEAVAVDLPGGKTLFALLRMANATSADDHVGIMSMMTMDPAMTNTKKDQSAKRIARGDGIKSPANVAPENYPMLVMFRDNSDPTSVELVDPQMIGVKRIMVEVTEEDVTAAIEGRLAEMGIEPGRGLDRTKGVTANPTLAQTLGYNDFVKGHQ